MIVTGVLRDEVVNWRADPSCVSARAEANAAAVESHNIDVDVRLRENLRLRASALPEVPLAIRFLKMRTQITPIKYNVPATAGSHRITEL